MPSQQESSKAMNPNLPHMAVVKRNQFGMYYVSCTCGFEGPATQAQHASGMIRETHLKASMEADVGAVWALWLGRDELPEEPAQRG